jgi:hypothetical protein
MSFLSRFFEPANVKNHRLAAVAAHRLRQQVFINLDIEIGLLSSAAMKSTGVLNGLGDLYEKDPAGADEDLIKMIGDIRIFRADTEQFFDALGDAVAEAQGRIEAKSRNAKTASDYAEVMQEEIEFREGLTGCLTRARALVGTSNEVLTAPLERLGPEARQAFFGRPMAF